MRIISPAVPSKTLPRTSPHDATEHLLGAFATEHLLGASATASPLIAGEFVQRIEHLSRRYKRAVAQRDHPARSPPPARASGARRS